MESAAATTIATVQELPVGFIADCSRDSSRAHGAVRHQTRGTLLHEQLLLGRWRGSIREPVRQQRSREGMHWDPIIFASSGFTSARKKSTTTTRVDAAAAAPADDVASDPFAAKATEQPQQLQDVVIVGGGMAGLATALALHRLGVKSLLLEQSDRLRTAGSTIGIWSNAWRALDALGVSDNLREKFVRILGFEFYAADGNCLLSLSFKDVARDVEVRGVERKALLEALREPLPDGTVLYDSQVVGIRKLDGGYTEVECKNGSTIQTKVLIGCDGAGSVVARWMDFKEPRYAGYTAIRGLAVFPDGHEQKKAATQIIGRGVRTGIIPMDSNRLYWFVVFNSSSGERITDAELVRKEALNYVQGWPNIVIDAINKSPLESLSRRRITDRWMWPVGGAPLFRGGVTLAGDAMHPMTPNLGQGGCCALEDAVVLARALSKALSATNSTSGNGSHEEMERIELALKSYTEERWRRMLPMAIKSYAIGAVLQLDFELVCWARNKLLPKIFTMEGFIGHTFYDCGTLS